MYGSSTGTLNVYMKDKDGKSTLVWSKSGDQGNKWIEAKLTLESKLDYKVKVMIFSFNNGIENALSEKLIDSIA